MEGSSEEYERLTLAALKKAASPDSDATYHNNRAAIFAHLAQAAASAEMADALTRMSALQGAGNGAGTRPTGPPATAMGPATAPAPTPGTNLVRATAAPPAPTPPPAEPTSTSTEIVRRESA